MLPRNVERRRNRMSKCRIATNKSWSEKIRNMVEINHGDLLFAWREEKRRRRGRFDARNESKSENGCTNEENGVKNSVFLYLRTCSSKSEGKKKILLTSKPRTLRWQMELVKSISLFTRLRSNRSMCDETLVSFVSIRMFFFHTTHSLTCKDWNLIDEKETNERTTDWLRKKKIEIDYRYNANRWGRREREEGERLAPRHCPWVKG